MALDRRGFMASILALGCAPWIARNGILMPTRPPHTEWLELSPTFTAFDYGSVDLTAILRYKRVGDIIMVESISYKDFYAN